MRITSESGARDQHLRWFVDGPWNLREIFALIDRIRWDTELAGVDQAFADMRGVHGPAPMLDRFFAGERVAAVLGGRVRLAVLARPEMVSKIGEKAAVSRGARILVTTSEPEALAFLA
jgi:hypothetical protein